MYRLEFTEPTNWRMYDVITLAGIAEELTWLDSGCGEGSVR